jgi:hypothetical protein
VRVAAAWFFVASVTAALCLGWLGAVVGLAYELYGVARGLWEML